MFIIHGVYRWWPKRVAFRNDYCRSCEAPRRAIATRTFDVGHIFWVPLIPVGFWKHWSCATCRRDPHAATKTRRIFKWIGLVCLILLAIMFWTLPDPDIGVAGVAWALRILSTGGAIALLIHLIVTPKDAKLRDLLTAIPPASDSICPFCATPLMAGIDGGRWTCPNCGAVRY
jgi:hypothetical protein